MRQRTPLQIVSDGEIAWENPSWVAGGPSQPAVLRRAGQGDARRRRRRRPSRLTILRRRIAALGILGLLIWVAFQLVQGDAAPSAGTAPVVAESSPRTAGGESVGPQVSQAVLKPVSSGDRGRAVRALQVTLATLGYEVGAADGVYQRGTAAAVTAFQRDSSLPADGVAGQTTVDEIVAALASRLEESRALVARGITGAQRDGRLTDADTRTAREALGRVVAAMGTLPVDGQATVIAALADVAASARDLDRSRALVFAGMLHTAVGYLRSHRVPEPGSTITDADGVSYRLFAAHGFQFHPLAAFAALNMKAKQGKKDAARRLAHALIDRAEPASGGLVWEYSFPFGGPQRWTSGFAQAVAATALLRTAELTDDAKIRDAAEAAFRTIPRSYLHETHGGQWILEYSQSSLLILNAQMQSLILLSDYARITHDQKAEQVAAAMLAAIRAALPSLDLGCWSRYSIGGNRATTGYHRYHISLLRRLARITGDASFGEIAARWENGLRGAC